MTETIEIDEEAYQILMRLIKKRSRNGEDVTFSGAIKHMDNVISNQNEVLDGIIKIVRS